MKYRVYDFIYGFWNILYEHSFYLKCRLIKLNSKFCHITEFLPFIGPFVLPSVYFHVECEIFFCLFYRTFGCLSFSLLVIYFVSMDSLSLFHMRDKQTIIWTNRQSNKQTKEFKGMPQYKNIFSLL